jgi:hypothetical protein
MYVKIVVSAIALCLGLAFVIGAILPFFKYEYAFAQTDQNTLSEPQRLGTNTILSFPDVNMTDINGQSIASLEEEFVLMQNNSGNSNQTSVAIMNPNYSLSIPIPKLIVGQNFKINSTSDEDIRYITANVKLAPILFTPGNVSLSYIDPEADMQIGQPIDLGNYNNDTSGNFVIPQITQPGNYILYVYLHYPYGVTGVFSNELTVAKQ